MNFVFVSPQFPDVYWRFCVALRRDGARVLGVGDTPYDLLRPELKESLDEYYWVSDLGDYDQVFRAVAFFSFKYGKVDWIESNNEHWLEQDARLREDFNVLAGPRPSCVARWRSKAAQKPFYVAAGVPTARQTRLTTFDETRWFIGEMGHYPVFAKPEFGVGSCGTRLLTCDDDLRSLIADHGDVPYVVEQYVEGDICSWDAILDSRGEPLFENQEEFPPSMADVARLGLDMSYRSCPTVDPELSRLGRATARAFGLTSRFVHLEFFRLAHDRPGLGAAGDYVGLEVNVRPPGGSSPPGFLRKISPPLSSIAFIMASDVAFFTMKSGFFESFGASAVSSSKPKSSLPLSLSCASFVFDFLKISSSFSYWEISRKTRLSRFEKRALILALLPVELSPTPRM